MDGRRPDTRQPSDRHQTDAFHLSPLSLPCLRFNHSLLLILCLPPLLDESKNYFQLSENVETRARLRDLFNQDVGLDLELISSPPVRHGQGSGEFDHGEQRAFSHQECTQHRQGRPYREG